MKIYYIDEYNKILGLPFKIKVEYKWCINCERMLIDCQELPKLINEFMLIDLQKDCRFIYLCKNCFMELHESIMQALISID